MERGGLHNRILLIDDEPALRLMVSEHLKAEGFDVTGAGSCLEALNAILSDTFDIAVLDVMLPDGDGFELFLRLKRSISLLPVLFLSARDEDADRLRGLGLGADDYMTKPFLLQELTLRLKAILRRVYGGTADGAAQTLDLFGTTVDLDGDKVVRPDGSETSLTGTELKLLRKLCDNRGRIVTTDALICALWPDGGYGYENSLMVHIRRLREKIEVDPSNPGIIQTVRGLGYKIEREKKS